MDETLSNRIKRSIEKAAEEYPEEYAGLLPKKDLPEPDPDTDKKYFSGYRQRYETSLDSINRLVNTGSEFNEVDLLNESLQSLNSLMERLDNTPQTGKRNGVLKKIIGKIIRFGIGSDIDTMKQSLNDVTRILNNLNHKTRIFAGNQEVFNSEMALYGQHVVPVIDEKVRVALKRHSTWLKDRMDIFHENIDLRQTEISNWLHNLVKRLDILEAELVRGLSLQHKKLERVLSFSDELSSQKPIQTNAVERLPEASAGMGDYAYYCFETRGRGPESFVRESQKQYVQLFKNVDPVLDLGCGRGEFLELLRDAGISAKGVDTNLDMVNICSAKNLNVIQRDAMTALDRCKPESLGGIFSGQLVEHLTVRELVMCLNASFIALKPGGVIVFETVNTSSVYALVNHFFKDPTHQLPRHPDTYRFLTASAGFADVQIRYTSPVPDEVKVPSPTQDLPENAVERPLLSDLTRITDHINSTVYAPCDIAVIARKPSDDA